MVFKKHSTNAKRPDKDHCEKQNKEKKNLFKNVVNVSLVIAGKNIL